MQLKEQLKPSINRHNKESDRENRDSFERKSNSKLKKNN
jgi:hypothetical protein